jgi:phosphatidylglycerol:prolipoprotein diacylglycerol transferase
MIGVIIACWLFSRNHRAPIGHVFDLAAFASTVGLFLGRIANFINAELWGKALPVSMQSNPPWWSVKYPQEIVEHWAAIALDPNRPVLDLVRHVAIDFNIDPAQAEPALREAVAQAATDRIAQLESLRAIVPDSNGFYDNVVAAAQHGNSMVVQTVKPLLTAYYPSQIFQAITDGPVLIGLLALLWLRPRKPGFIASWFLIIYAVLRIATELFRQPDVGVVPRLGLSQGQWLSVAMIVAGLIGLWLTHRSPSQPLPGLSKPKDTPGLQRA